MEKDEMDVLKDQLAKAKQPLIDSLVKDSKGSFAKDNLERLDVETLTKLRSLFNDVVNAEYQTILNRRIQRDHAERKLGTVGTYNQETQEFEDGI